MKLLIGINGTFHIVDDEPRIIGENDLVCDYPIGEEVLLNLNNNGEETSFITLNKCCGREVVVECKLEAQLEQRNNRIKITGRATLYEWTESSNCALTDPEDNVDITHYLPLGGESTYSFDLYNFGWGFGGDLAEVTLTFSNRLNKRLALANNQLIVREGSTTILTSENLRIVDDDPNNYILYTVSGVQEARFALTTSPTTSIINFSPLQISNQQVMFIHNGEETAPTYWVAAQHQYIPNAYSIPAPANITFINENDPPRVIHPIPDESIVPEEEIRKDLKKIFFDPDNSPDELTYFASLTEGNSSAITYNLQDGILAIAASAPGRYAFAVSAYDPQDTMATDSFALQVTNDAGNTPSGFFDSVSNRAIVAGVGAAGILASVGLWAYKKWCNKNQTLNSSPHELDLPNLAEEGQAVPRTSVGQFK